MMEVKSSGIASNERSNDCKQTNETVEYICEFFSPLRDQWPFIQEVLIWRKLEISVIVFNILNVVFWIFLTPRLQLLVTLAIFLSLLWLTPPIRHWILSNIRSQNQLSSVAEKCVDSDDSGEVLSEGAQVRSEKNITSYYDFCHGVAVVWSFLITYWIKLKALKEKNAKQFYLVVSLLVVAFSVIYARFPIANILYIIVMFLYLWPAVVFYGIKDKVLGKFIKLFTPFFTQWQSSRTKRKRDTHLKDHQKFSDVSDDEEDFILNSAETEGIHRSHLSPEERTSQAQPAGPPDSVNSSLTFIDGLEFPSMRRDSVESFNSDDFVQGLNFSGITPGFGSHHSSMDSLHDTTSYSQNNGTNQNDHSQTNVENCNPLQPECEPERRQILEEQSRSEVRPPSLRKSSSDDVESYEVIDTSEIQVDFSKQEQQGQAQGQDDSYIASGTAYMGKFFGY
ncbi:reticulophagy regulator 3-like [Dendronephthya gigantea]|uniref:reticulophagy regulator 3-like n=1 Tax=Dendronephthya gigantea TaxID=151771 RepID=UPI00106B24B3|nr:reticulophagy regulator 3-like [Dendronephthya gigantea]